MSRERTSFPSLAALATFGAALAFIGVGAATRALGGDPVGMAAGAIVMTLAGVLLLAPRTQPGGLLLAWNGLGIAAGLFVIGIFSVGALMIFPLTLTALALSSWPRTEGEGVASPAAMVVQVTGFLLAMALHGVLHDVTTGLRRLVGD